MLLENYFLGAFDVSHREPVAIYHESQPIGMAESSMGERSEL